MYNRYIPQADGTYRRNTVQEQPKPEQNQTRPVPPPKEPECPPQKPPRQQPHNTPPRKSKPRPQQPNRDGNVLSFLRQLLPKDFDTADLLVVILLLLMSSDCTEDQNTALLTLALYLFM